jgi:hypothetical protein
MPAFGAWSFDDGAEGVALPKHLALENSAVLQRQVKHIALRRIRHWIEHDDGRRSCD